MLNYNPETEVKRARSEFKNLYPNLNHSTVGVKAGRYISERTLKAYRIYRIDGVIACTAYLRETENEK